MLEQLKKDVCKANLALKDSGLVIFNWGNVSSIDETEKYVVIKPSGVDYTTMTYEDMVVTDLNGNIVDGYYKPSSDLLTHLEIYRNFKDIKAIVHTHSKNATSWAQSGKDIPALGTTHADYFYGNIPCTRKMTEEEIRNDYELNTGKVIVETLKERNVNPKDMPAVIVNSHGPFCWGNNANNAVHNAIVLEELADIAFKSMVINPNLNEMQKELLDRHYLRKHGANAYYGQ